MLLLATISTIMFFFCLYLYYDNKKLKEKVEKLELDIKTVLDKKLTPSKEDIISIEKISIPKEEAKEKTIIKEEKNIENNPLNTITPSKYKKEKYIARTTSNEYIKPNIAKPTENILNKTTDEEKYKNYKTELITSASFEPTEFIKKNNINIANLKNKTPVNNTNYLNEISKQLDNALTSQTINLTDYEKEQEEHAIISYQELLSLKEKNNNEKKDDEYFVEDLKEFYSLLD